MRRVLIPLVIVAGLIGAPAQATVTEERIVAELRDEGYTRIEIRRTLLGRTRIIAASPAYDREIIINPATGVIMRDLLRVRSGSGGSNGAGASDRSGGGSSGGGSTGGGGSGGGGAQGDSDDDDDDDSGSDESDDDDDGGSSDGSGGGDESGGDDDDD